MPNHDQPSHDGPVSMVKALPTLGHAVVDWWEHGLAIINDLTKHPERDPALAALVTEGVAACGRPPSPFLRASSETLAMEVSWGADEAWWITDIPSTTRPSFLLQCWLLHLPALNPQWKKRMRSARLELLKHIVPGAWLPQPQPDLPPGAIIAGLSVTDWTAAERLPQVARETSGMMFEIKPATGHRSTRYHRSDAGRVEKH